MPDGIIVTWSSPTDVVEDFQMITNCIIVINFTKGVGNIIYIGLEAKSYYEFKVTDNMPVQVIKPWICYKLENNPLPNSFACITAICHEKESTT